MSLGEKKPANTRPRPTTLTSFSLSLRRLDYADAIAAIIASGADIPPLVGII
jgi:hypothetical protein